MTAETAVVLPAMVLVLAAGLWALSIGDLQARCAAAARSAALANARGESAGAASARVSAALGPRATLALTRTGPRVTARVSAQRPGIGLLPAWTVAGTVTAELEPVSP